MNKRGGVIGSSDTPSFVRNSGNKKLRILFLGNFRPENSTENDLAWTMEDLGFEVFRKQEDVVTTDELLMWADLVDVFFYIHTHGWVTNGSFSVKQLIGKFRRKGIISVGYHLDYWYGLDRAVDVGRDDFWSVDYMFTPDGDERSLKWFKKLKINHYYMPPAVVKRDCYLAEMDKTYKSDIIFVGSKNYHPEWQYRTDLIEWLHKTYKNRFRHWGGDGIRTVRGHQLNTLYASAKVAVGDSLCLNFDHEYYWSDRVYETRGRGGFLIHPEIVGLDDVMVKYEYKNFDQLKSLIDYYVNHDDEREALRIKNFEYVRENHTYHNRLREAIKIIGYGKFVE